MITSKRYLLSRFILLTAGALLGAVGVVLFLLPNQIAPSGLSGIGVILNDLFGVPVGAVIVVGNIPVLFLAYRYLFGWRAVLPTLYVVLLYSLAIDFIPLLFSVNRLSDDLLLNAIFGGIITGVGGGMIFRGGGSLGGSSTLGRILRSQFKLSLSTASLFTDIFVLAAAGLVFGWEAALYAVVTLFINRAISDYLLDGSSQSYTALIISHQTASVTKAINQLLHHRVVAWRAGDKMRDQRHALLMVSIYRTELHGLRQLIEKVDPAAFVTILEARATYGAEFEDLASHLPFKLDQIEDSVSRRVETKKIEEVISS